MRKPRKKRECSVCHKVKKSTNTEVPFICETPCLRIKGRKLMLRWNDYKQVIVEQTEKQCSDEYKGGLVVVGVISFIIGLVAAVYVFPLIKYIIGLF